MLRIAYLMIVLFSQSKRQRQLKPETDEFKAAELVRKEIWNRTTASALFYSIVNDVDVVLDWIFVRELSVDNGETVTNSAWQWAALTFAISGTILHFLFTFELLSWWIFKHSKKYGFPIQHQLEAPSKPWWMVFFACLFDAELQYPPRWLILLANILLEDFPQIIISACVSSLYYETTNVAILNIITSVYSILAKAAVTWETRDASISACALPVLIRATDAFPKILLMATEILEKVPTVNMNEVAAMAAGLKRVGMHTSVAIITGLNVTEIPMMILAGQLQDRKEDEKIHSSLLLRRISDIDERGVQKLVTILELNTEIKRVQLNLMVQGKSMLVELLVELLAERVPLCQVFLNLPDDNTSFKDGKNVHIVTDEYHVWKE